ncbi:MAG: hypothetical protein LBU17_02975 [Treponema sp.]|nr:hypothetical protein [Treponema sp.]
MNRQPFTTWFLILCMTWVMGAILFSGVFVFSRLDHDCTGSTDCLVCLELQTAQHLLKQLETLGALVLAAASVKWGIRCLEKPRFFCDYPITAITLKVRLNT